MIFRGVVAASAHAAGDLAHVDGLDAHAEPFFPQFGVNDGSGDAHRGTAHGEVTLAAHEGHGEGALGEGEEFFPNISGDLRVTGGLHVLAVNAESRQSLLRVAGDHGGQIDRAGALGAVESPDGFRRVRVHVHRFRAITPAGRHGEGNADVGEPELVRAIGRLSNSADAGVRDDALDRRAIRITQHGSEEVRHRPGLLHGAFLKRFANAAEAAVNGRTNADLWIRCLFHGGVGNGCCRRKTLRSRRWRR